jgi:hypothetical protein
LPKRCSRRIVITPSLEYDDDQCSPPSGLCPHWRGLSLWEHFSGEHESPDRGILMADLVMLFVDYQNTYHIARGGEVNPLGFWAR